MASPFAKYQSEQVQQIAPGFVEAYGRAGAAIGQGIAAIGDGIGNRLLKNEEEKAKELANKAALAPYIRNDQRVQVVEGLFNTGVLTKAPDGTAVISAAYAGKFDTTQLEKSLSFYNQTGGDGSKLTGDALKTFTAQLAAEQKFSSDQAAKVAAQLDQDLKRAQIDEISSKAAERAMNAGLYKAGIEGLTVGEVAPLPTSIPGINKPAEPVISAALTAGTNPNKDVPDAPVKEPAPVGPPTQKEAKAFTASIDNVTPAPPVSPAASPPNAPGAVTDPAKATSPSAVVYDVPAESVRVQGEIKKLEVKRTAIVADYEAKRVASQGVASAARRNFQEQFRNAPRTKTGFDVTVQAKAANETYHKDRLNNIDEAEARELKGVDDAVASINRGFTIYQSGAAASAAARAENRAIAKNERDIVEAERALTKEENEFISKLANNYPMIGLFTYRGYGLKDPTTGKRVDPSRAANIAAMGTEQRTEAVEQNKGYGSAQNFLLNMSDVLAQREAGGDESSYLERFRLFASDLENYYKAEQASVFGVATFRKAIVSGGNFSDADREFVKQAITYLNSGAVDLTNADLRSSLNALTFMLDGMYRVNLEELGMSYNKKAASETATKLRYGGDEAGASSIDNQITRYERFNSTFNLKAAKASTISRQQIAEARLDIIKSIPALRNFKYVPQKK